MRKKIVAMISAMIGLVAMATVANAATVNVEYDAVNSTNSVAKYAVYTDGVSGNVKSMAVEIKLDAAVCDTASVTKDSFVYPQEIDNVTFKTAYKSGTARCQLIEDSSVVFEYDETQPIITFEVPVSAAAKSNITVKVSGTWATGFTAPTADVEQILPQTAVVADSTVVDDNAEEAKATYWTTEANLVEGATPYWYANVNGDAKKVEANVPSVSGAAKLGLIVEGDDVVTNVKIVQE